MSQQGQSTAERSSRLPRGLRGLASLTTINTRVDNMIANLATLRARLDNNTKKVETLDKQVKTLNKQVKTLDKKVKQQNERLAATTRELEVLRVRDRARMRSARGGLEPEEIKAQDPVLLKGSEAPVGKKKMPDEEVRAEISKVGHWYHRIEVAPGIVTPGTNNSDAVLRAMDVPERLDGKRVLDVGARDGYFSFVAEDRGAEVLAIDAMAPDLTGFSTAAKFMESSVEYRTMNVYDVSPEEIGTFDIIFFLGVLYHLRDPILVLDRLWSVANPGATIWVESHTIDRGFVDLESKGFVPLLAMAPEIKDVPIAQFYPEDLLSGDRSNWWGPNQACLEEMVKAAGFEPVQSKIMGHRGLVIARRTEDEQTSFFRDFDRSVVTRQPDPGA
jgi:tRNA (mo5U34)-methyltransferase